MDRSKLIKGVASGLAGLSGSVLATLWGLKLLHARQVKAIWRSLQVNPNPAIFSEDMVAGLPELAQRYLLHAIRPGSRLASSVQMKFRGTFKDSPTMRPMPFRGSRILTPYRGFVWQGVVEGFVPWNRPGGPWWETGVSFYANGAALERSKYFDLVPIFIKMNNPPDVARMFLGRFLSESVLIPSALLPQQGVAWTAIDREHVSATISCDGEHMTLKLKVDPDGRLREVSFDRWGSKGTVRQFQYIPCGIEVMEEATFDGYTIPSRHSYTWWYKSAEREPSLSFDYTIEQARFN